MILKNYRVIDANLNRAKEGLRVMEDICRFILDNPELTEQLKQIRHQLNILVQIPERFLVESRDSERDVGRSREVLRKVLVRQIFTANTKRVTEALRVLEEFLPEGNVLKEERYKVYEMEKNISKKLRLALPFEKDIYVVSDQVSVLQRAAQDGAAIVQLRDKTGSQDSIYQKALAMVGYKKTQEKDFVFILNDYPELAVKSGADGVHIGQDSPTAEARSIVGPALLIGKTTHDLQQALEAQAQGANYVSVGPVYATPTKPGRPAVGLEYVREAAAKLDLPFVAIGGIDVKNIDQVLEAGARAVGLVRAAVQTPELLKKVRNYAN